MNADDRRLAEQIGRVVTEAILTLGPRGRVWVEAQTDARGHVRSQYRIEKVVSVTDGGGEKETALPHR